MSEPLHISVGATPNPNAAKLTLNRTVAVTGQTYRGDPSAVEAPWAKALLGIPGIVGVFGINNFISVNKTPESSWETILPQAQDALRRVWATG